MQGDISIGVSEDASGSDQESAQGVIDDVAVEGSHSLQNGTTSRDNQAISANTVRDINAKDNARLHIGNSVTNLTTVTNVHHLEQTRQSILYDLAELSCRERKNINRRRVPGTCQWFLSHELYVKWRDYPTSAMLHVTADPGCGKSVLSRHLVDEELPTALPDSTIAYFFFKDGLDLQTSVLTALRCLLHQILIAREDLFTDAILRRFQESSFLLSSAYELWDLLVDVTKLPAAGTIICILDAYDECNPDERAKLSKILYDFYDLCKVGDENNKLKILLTSRPYDDIKGSFATDPLSKIPIIHLGGEDQAQSDIIAQEIDLVLRAEVHDLSRQLGQNERSYLLECLTSVPNRTYLWVHLVLNMIHSNLPMTSTELAQLVAPGKLPSTVEDAYEAILRKSKNPVKAKRLLEIVVAATRPLRVTEIAEAMAVTQDHKTHSDLPHMDEELIPSYLRSLCGLFINIIDSQVFLLHLTAKDFLLAKYQPSTRRPAEAGTGHSSVWAHSIQVSSAHRQLAKICVQYALLSEFQTLETFMDTSQKKPNMSDKLAVLEQQGITQASHPFLWYAAQNWYIHCRTSSFEDTAAMVRLCGWPTTNERRSVNWMNANFTKTEDDGQLFSERLTPLMIAACCGLPAVVSFIIQRDSKSIKEREPISERSALSFAAEQGSSDTIAILLSVSGNLVYKMLNLRDRQIKNSCSIGLSPLAYAALNGHTDAVRLLLKAGGQLSKQDNNKRDILSYAVCSGNQEVVKLLLKDWRGLDQAELNSRIGGMAYRAILEGRIPLLHRILATGRVDLHYECDKGSTSGKVWFNHLRLEVSIGHETCQDGSSCILLKPIHDEHDEDEIEHGGSVKTHYVRNASAEPLTLLQLAVAMGNISVVTTLLEYAGNANVNGSDSEWGISPLHWAAAGHQDSKRSVSICNLLLGKGAVPDPCSRYNGTSPLQWAVTMGELEVARILILRGADVNHVAVGGIATLEMSRSFEMVQLLVSQGARFIDGLEHLEETDKRQLRRWISEIQSTTWDANNAGLKIQMDEFMSQWSVSQLRNHMSSSWASKIWSFRTHLVFFAIEEERPDILETLLAGLSTDSTLLISPYNKYCRKVHDRAIDMWFFHIGYQKREYIDLLELLLTIGANPLILDQDGRGVIHKSAYNGHVRTVRLMLGCDADVNLSDALGQVPLQFAAGGGHYEVARLLLNNGAVVNCRTSKCATALHFAAWNGHIDTVQLLLDRDALIDGRTKDDATALHYAAQYGYTSTVQLLLDRGALIDGRTDGWTALHFAAKNGHTSIVQLLLDRGALIDSRAKHVATALHYAAQNGHTSIVQLLLDRGSLIDSRARHDATALHYAAKSGHTSIAQLLLDRGLSIDGKTDDGQTALHLAARGGHTEAVRLLLESGAELGRGTNTALLRAIKHWPIGIVELLLEKETSMSSATRRSLVTRAAKGSHTDLV